MTRQELLDAAIRSFPREMLELVNMGNDDAMLSGCRCTTCFNSRQTVEYVLERYRQGVMNGALSDDVATIEWH